MKTVYIDVLVTVNIFIDFFLLLCTQKALHIRTPYKRMIFAGIIGGIESLAALLPMLNFAVNLFIDVAGAAIIIFAAFGKCNIKTYVKRVAVYFSFSFSFCGIMIFVFSVFKPKGMEIYNNVVYFNISPVLLIILTLVCYYILKFIKRMTNGVNGVQTYNIEIDYDNSHFLFCAKADSGCTVKEPFSGNSVIVAEKCIFEKISFDETKLRVIPFESLGGTGIIKGFKPQKIIVDGKEIANDIYIGICENVLSGDIKALIPTEITDKIN